MIDLRQNALKNAKHPVARIRTRVDLANWMSESNIGSHIFLYGSLLYVRGVCRCYPINDSTDLLFWVVHGGSLGVVVCIAGHESEREQIVVTT